MAPLGAARRRLAAGAPSVSFQVNFSCNLSVTYYTNNISIFYSTSFTILLSFFLFYSFFLSFEFEWKRERGRERERDSMGMCAICLKCICIQRGKEEESFFLSFFLSFFEQNARKKEKGKVRRKCSKFYGQTVCRAHPIYPCRVRKVH